MDLSQATLEAVKPRRYVELPNLVPATITWLESTPPPDIAVCGEDLDGRTLLITARNAGPGATTVGMFTLGDATVRPKLLHNMKTADGSLAELGPVRGGTVAYALPVPSPTVPEETLAKAGYPATESNLSVMAHQFMIMATIKGSQFFERIGDPTTARRKVDVWSRWTDQWGARGQLGPSGLLDPVAMVLRDIAEADSSALPYIQDFVPRIAAIMLDVTGGTTGTFWDKMNR